ncbi:serine/threonine-protein kinase 19 isoform X5 [Rhodamnia argentea]|uniref:Serine/threonine-protein kinase 19 isoform X5 n=1 Tax=Rhodamnia argentea TaxID=178133 RepID=A0A8B8R4G7_9MYRT|nr:serine/threonine-protein kinase 19 isoform X5 [Rhodamnia argentea]
MSTQDPSSSSPSKGTKRRRDEEEAAAADDAETAASESLEQSLTFSDTLVALRMMRAQFPHIDKVSIRPFVLRSQLYSSVVDRTQVDRELESLRRTKVLRIFKLNTGQDDHAIMFLDDYLNQCSLLSLGGKVKDNQISVLINGGVIIRQLIDPSMYWFAIPNVGSMLKGLSQGRKELLSLLSRRRYKEMLLASLEKKRLRLSPLDMRFHLRDLIGSGHLKTIKTPTGLVVRISKE